MIYAAERDPKKRPLALVWRWLSAPLALAVALMLVLAGFPGEHWLNRQWLRLTTTWHWQSEAPAPRYRVQPGADFGASQVIWPTQDGALRLGPIYGPVHPIHTAVDSPGSEWLTAATLALLPNTDLMPSRQPSERFWQPAHWGYKPLFLQTDAGLVPDAQLSLLAPGEAWTYRPAIAASSASHRLDLDIRGGLLLADFAVPDPVFEALADDSLPVLPARSAPGVAAVREHWALHQGFYLVTPWWLSLAAVIAVALPWVLPRPLGRWYWIGAAGMVAWVAGNLALAILAGWWLPLWYPLASVALAGVVHRRWYRSMAGQQSLLTEYRELAGLWLQHLLDSGKTEAGHRFVTGSATLSGDPELTYELAQGFERKRQYESALRCFDRLAATHPGFRDVQDRRARLLPLTEGSQTLVIGSGRRSMATEASGVQAPELGRYRILRELGRGAMGVVYEAEDPKIHRRVALKVVQLDSLEAGEAESVKQRFFREAQAAGRLNHPNIVTVFDVGEERDLAYIAMDRLQGQSLSLRLQEPPMPAVAQVCDWMAQAADALDFAHRNDIVHRDIKPANLYLDEAGNRLMVTDFGVARIADIRQTQTGIVLGSPSYMAPEQIRGDPLTGRTDIFSLGVTLYQALCGQLPFQGETLPSLAYAITHTQQESPRKHNPEIPVALVRIVNKALKKDPSERYASAGDMAQALRKWAGAGE